jgi:hypothetical protein
MPEGGFTTDGEVLIEAGQLLAAVADQAGPAAERLAADTHLPAEAYGNVALPPALNFTGELAQLLQGPYDELRTSMTRVVNRTAAAIEANGKALSAAGRLYLVEDEKWVSIFDSALPDELRNRPTTGGEPDRPTTEGEPDRPTGHEPDGVEG